MYRLKAIGLGKRFESRKVFSGIDFDLTTGQSLAVVGPNGSGKSTLLKILLSLLRPSRGEVVYEENGVCLEADHIRDLVSFVSPYLTLYDQLTAEENITFFASVGGRRITGSQINGLLARVGLKDRGADYVAGYSSGMKQRLKYAVALLKEPAFLILDEPTSNLDEAGKQIVAELIGEYKSRSIVVLATNEQEEYGLADQLCRVDR